VVRIRGEIATYEKEAEELTADIKRAFEELCQGEISMVMGACGQFQDMII